MFGCEAVAQVVLDVEVLAAEGTGINNALSGLLRRSLKIEFLGTAAVCVGDTFAGSACRVGLV